MLVTPVNTAYQPVSKTRPISWQNVAKSVANAKANDNPALEITKNVPTDQFKGRFIDVLS